MKEKVIPFPGGKPPQTSSREYTPGEAQRIWALAMHFLPVNEDPMDVSFAFRHALWNAVWTYEMIEAHFEREPLEGLGIDGHTHRIDMRPDGTIERCVV